MTRLLAAAGAFAATVIGGFLIGLLAARLTGADWWVVVGLFGGLAVGVGAVVAALRPLMRSN